MYVEVHKQVQYRCFCALFGCLNVFENQKQELFGPLISTGAHTVKIKQLERNCTAESLMRQQHHLYFTSSITNNRSQLSKASLCSSYPVCCLKWDLDNATSREKQV